MNIFFDTEFTGLHQNTTLISIGCVSDDGREFYAEFDDYDKSQIDDWIRENIINRMFLQHLKSGEIATDDNDDYSPLYVKGSSRFVKLALDCWLSFYNEVEMWSDCLAYDWVLFCQLFGGGVECLPRNIYYIPFDICTLFKVKNIDPNINREMFAFGAYLQEMKDQKHNALWDAKVIKACYEKLMGK